MNITPLQQSLHVRTVFISDVHLGFPGCSAEFLTRFLRQVRCDELYLVGDIIDFWYLRKNRYWPQEHSNVMREILGKAKHGTKVYLIPGNHDEALRPYNGLSLGNLQVMDRRVHTMVDGRRLLVLHGDQFDAVVRCSPMLAVVGAKLYDLLLKMNGWINKYRRWRGQDYWSLAAFLKHKVKNAVSYISNFEKAVVHEAAEHDVDGVVCGHIHRAEISPMGDLHYLNCGDWVESCTALLERHSGEIELIQWRESATTIKTLDPLPDSHVDPEPRKGEIAA